MKLILALLMANFIGAGALAGTMGEAETDQTVITYCQCDHLYGDDINWFIELIVYDVDTDTIIKRKRLFPENTFYSNEDKCMRAMDLVNICR